MDVWERRIGDGSKVVRFRDRTEIFAESMRFSQTPYCMDLSSRGKKTRTPFRSQPPDYPRPG